jgi:hypothetical protein
MAADLRADNTKVEVALRELTETNLVQVDAATSYVWVLDLFQIDVMLSRDGEFKSGDRVLTGAIAIFHSIPEVFIKKLFHKKFAKQYFKRLESV